MGEPGWVPEGVDTERAGPSRVYDYLLGGTHNFAVDRAAALALLEDWPDARFFAEQNRAFLRRAVRLLLDAGIRQFLDLGSGIPTAGHFHDGAEDARGGARVVYVDNDEMAIAHTKATLSRRPDAGAVLADIREPAAVLADPVVSGMIDFSAPVGLLMGAVIHFVTDEHDPAGVIRHFTAALAPGSHVVLSHGTADDHADVAGAAERTYRERVDAVVPRTRSSIRGYLDGLEILPPGVVYLPEWRPAAPLPPGEDPSRCLHFAAVARKP